MLAAVALAAPLYAADRSALFAQWGTEAQCSGAIIKPGGTVRASAFDIRPDWLGHRNVWCRLIWSGTVSTVDGLIATATGLCGEDAVRDYRLRFSLSGDELTIIWNHQHKNGPLSRCDSAPSR